MRKRVCIVRPVSSPTGKQWPSFRKSRSIRNVQELKNQILSTNLISTFLFLSLGRYLCWWTISDSEGIVHPLKGVAYVEETEAAASVTNICKNINIKTIKLYFHVLNKGTINKLTD